MQVVDADQGEFAAPASRNYGGLHEEGECFDGVVSAAVLATLAFRLKDERGLVTALRQLTVAVDALERSRDDA
jgi:hypothetical protein